MGLLRAVGGHLWGLFFDDGQLALGIIVALGAAALAAAGPLRPVAGWILLVLLAALVLANLAAAGRRARRKLTG